MNFQLDDSVAIVEHFSDGKILTDDASTAISSSHTYIAYICTLDTCMIIYIKRIIKKEYCK